jgi:hydrogenase maturation protease
VLIVCCGNPDRGDDAAGWLVAEHLRGCGVPAVCCSGDAFTLLEMWETGRDRDVLLVDAVVTGAPPGEIFEWDVTELPATREVFACSSHGFGVAEAIELGRALDKLPAKLRIVGIEGSEFGLGRPPTAAVINAAATLAKRLTEINSCACG